MSNRTSCFPRINWASVASGPAYHPTKWELRNLKNLDEIPLEAFYVHNAKTLLQFLSFFPSKTFEYISIRPIGDITVLLFYGSNYEQYICIPLGSDISIVDIDVYSLPPEILKAYTSAIGNRRVLCRLEEGTLIPDLLMELLRFYPDAGF